MNAARASLSLAVVLGAPLAVGLGVAGQARGLELPAGRGSQLFLEVVSAVAAALFAIVGVLITRVQPRNAIGWIFLGAGATFALTGVAYGYGDLCIYGGETWPGGTWAAWLASWLVIVPFFVAPCLVAQLFPDGSALPGRWTRLFRLSVVVAAYLAVAPSLDSGSLGSYPGVPNPAAVPRAVSRFIVDPTWGIGILALFALSLASIVVRYRRSRGVERQQLRWLAFSGSLVIVALIASFTLGDWLGPPWSVVVGGVAVVAVALVPVSVASAILRYRLYDIDRVVSRTLAYAILTIVLAAAYVGLVLAGQALFSSFAGGSNLAIAVSTLVVAALFLPLRARIQRVVDRRFYRRRYDAERTLETFGARLREQLDLDELSTELQAVVREVMEPTRVTVWLPSGGVTR